MKREDILERMSFVMYGEQLRRVMVYDNENNDMVIRVDTHGMCKESAQKALNNIIAIVRSPFILDVIHGYNGGTAIKQMVQKDLKSPKIVGRRSPLKNPGETLLQIA